MHWIDAHRFLRPVWGAVLALPGLWAQSQFAVPLQRGLPTNFDETVSVALGDIDGDGDLDLFTSAAFTRSLPFRNRLFENDGRGSFRDVSDRLTWNVESVGMPQFVDVDGDGDLDLVAIRGRVSGPVQVVLNDGNGRLTDASSSRLPAAIPDSGAVVVGDIDGDGDADILGLGYGRPSVQLRNDGAGRFTDTTALGLPGSMGAVISADLADVDGDGDLDLLCGRVTTPVVGGPDGLFLNDGSGRFVDVTAANLPMDAELTLSARLVDVDGDGDSDAVLTNFSGGVRLYENDGAGVFSSTTGRLSVGGAVGSIVTWDPDRDGDVDLILGGERYFANDGNGNFTEPAGVWPALPRGWSAAGDVDGDGDEDLVVGVNGPDRLVLTNVGGVPFLDVTRRGTGGGRGTDVAVGDLDGDLDLDVVFAGASPLLYDSGELVERTAALPGSVGQARRVAVAMGDVDGDQDLDVVFGTDSGGGAAQTQLLLNNGAGVFLDRTSNLPVDSDPTRDVLLEDIDGDGDLDLFLANGLSSAGFGQDRIYLNDGSGSFRDATSGLPQNASVQWSYSAAVGDVNGDGLVDLLVGGDPFQPPANRLFRNVGSGVFSDASADLPQAQLDIAGRQVFLADLDGDSDLDALFVGPTSVRLCLNDGTGVFVDATARLPVPVWAGWGAAVDDFDGDGDLDVFAHGSMMRNDGSANFTLAQGLWPVTPYVSSRTTAVDIDGDGDVDVIGNDERVFRNLHSQVEWESAPRIGRDAVFTVHGQRRSAAIWAFPIAAAVLSVPIPTSLGLLHVDPSRFVGLPVVVVPAGAGSVATRIPVPSAPFLVDVEFGLQALLVEPATARAWFSNPDRIRATR